MRRLTAAILGHHAERARGARTGFPLTRIAERAPTAATGAGERPDGERE